MSNIENDSGKKGELKIIVGPNGAGKTYYLKKESEEDKENSIFIPSEIVYKEETKDSKENSFLLNLILENIIEPNIIEQKEQLKNKIQQNIDLKKGEIQDILNEVAQYNGEKIEKDIINTWNLEMKKIVKINNDFLEKNIGSGQTWVCKEFCVNSKT